MSAHTPGPWAATRDRPGCNCHHIEAGAFRLARLDCSKRASPGNTLEADARLIAAAPEMLEALRSLLDAVDAAALSGMPGMDTRCEAARGVIAKADGK